MNEQQNKEFKKEINYQKLSVRLSNILKKYEIKYLEQLEIMTVSELLRLNNFGQQTLEEVYELLENRTKYFNEDNTNLKNDNSLGEQALKLLNSDLPLHIFSNRVRNICEGNGILKFGHLARLTRSKVHHLKNLGKDSFRGLENILVENGLYFGMHLNNIDWEIEENNSIDEPTLQILNNYLPLHIFSNKIRKICRKKEILKFGHLARLSRSKVESIDNLGRTSLRELENILVENGLYFGMHLNNIDWEKDSGKDLKTEIPHKYKKKLVNIINDLSEREKKVFFERLSGSSLEEVGQSLSITRERARQIEQKIYLKIVDYLGKELLMDQQKRFESLFFDIEDPVFIHKLIKYMPIFEGVETLLNYPTFINKLTKELSKKSNLNEIKYDKIDGSLPFFYPSNEGVLSFYDIFNKLKVIKNSLRLNSDEESLEDNDDIKLEILISKRRDIKEILIKKIISEKVFMSKTNQVVLFFKQQDALISSTEAIRIVSPDARIAIPSDFLYENDIFQFTRSGWGVAEKFHPFDEESEDIITDFLISFMEENPEKIYSTTELIKIVRPHLKYHIKENFIGDVTKYHIDVCLLRSSKRGKKIKNLKRMFWTLNFNQKRTFFKDLVYEVLLKKKKIMHYSEIVSEVQSQKSFNNTQIFEDDRIKSYGENRWGLQPDTSPKEKINNNNNLNQPSELSFNEIKKLIENFIELNLHSEIPKIFSVDNFKLGEWVNNIRKKNLYNEKIPNEYYLELNKINGWDWYSYIIEHKSNFYFKKIKAFVEQNKHSDISRDYNSNDFELGKYVYRLRVLSDLNLIHYKTKYNLNELEKWEWVSSPSKGKKSDSEDLYFALTSYFRANKNLNIKKGSIVGGIDLYNYVSSARSRYKHRERNRHLNIRKQGLSEEKIKRLEEIPGWYW